MIETIKTYFVEVATKNVAPKVIAAIMSYGIAFFIAHQEFMEQMGVTYYPDFNGTWHGIAPTGQIMVIEFDTLGKWGALALVAGGTALWSFFQHHAVATVTGAPQSGDKRDALTPMIAGGNRQDDPPDLPKKAA